MPGLIKKIIRRFKYYLQFIIPHNLIYKPSAVYPSAKQFARDHPELGSYKEIFPEHISRLDIDREFYEACPPYLEPHMEILQPSSYLLTLKNGRVVSGLLGRNIAYISADNHLVGGISFQWENDHLLPADKNKILKRSFFEQPKSYKGKVFSLLSGAAGRFNYFHWFIDTFPKIYLAMKAGIFDSIDWFLVPAYSYSFQKEYLSFLGISANRVIKGDRHAHIEAEELIVPSASRGVDLHIPTWICDFYRQVILPKVNLETGDKKRIYISRNDSKKRKVLNEDQLIPVLKKYGFEIHQLDNKTTEEQIRLFASAGFVLAPHGAGLSNLVYCQPGTRVVEFFPGGYVKQTYYDLSNKCGLDYSYIIFEKEEEANNAVEGQKIHIRADIEEIEKNIAEVNLSTL